MRITTWNVNGLRAAIGKNLLESVIELQPDVLCLQEIKTRPDQLDPSALQAISASFPSIVWHPAVRPGYSGTATWAKAAPSATQIGLGNENYDMEGRMIISQFPDFWLFNIYFPNGQHDLGRVPYKLDFYARLLDLCDHLHAQGLKLILCGDFNTAHNDIDLRHPRENANSTGFLPEERAWVDRYLQHGLVDIFRARYPARVEYTWWTYIGNARQRNVGWRLDYFLVSQALCDQIEDVEHNTGIMGSDHCPVTLILRD